MLIFFPLLLTTFLLNFFEINISFEVGIQYTYVKSINLIPKPFKIKCSCGQFDTLLNLIAISILTLTYKKSKLNWNNYHLATESEWNIICAWKCYFDKILFRIFISIYVNFFALKHKDSIKNIWEFLKQISSKQLVHQKTNLKVTKIWLYVNLNLIKSLTLKNMAHFKLITLGIFFSCIDLRTFKQVSNIFINLDKIYSKCKRKYCIIYDKICK